MDQESIGKFILELRKKNNLTQKQLADKLNVTAQAVSKWENGRGIPDIEILQKISIEFNVNIDSILKGKEKGLFSRKVLPQNEHLYLWAYQMILLEVLAKRW